MAVLKKCLICSKEFRTKPYFIRRGQGRFCSNACHYRFMRTGQMVNCGTCEKEIYRKLRSLRIAKTKNYFCNKSCQTVWRNQVYSGSNHKSWKHGRSSAASRSALKRAGKEKICEVCHTKDIRVLAVHHIDRDRTNNTGGNLAWLCHNCHFLVHHYDVGRDRGLLKPRS
ncbi:MAG: hypothetical protein RLZZ416_767 [Candidatus Parcubacteria bacterium]